MPLVVAFVPGVSPSKWAGVWAERMPHEPLELRPIEAPDAPGVLDAGVDMVLTRLPFDRDDCHVLPLWEETPVVVASKDHAIKVVDTVSEAELADEHVVAGWDDDALDLVAAGVGVARMPQSVFRAANRRELVARPITDAAPTRIVLAWRQERDDAVTQEFVGVVRGRKAHSSRGDATPDREAERPDAGRGASGRPRHPGSKSVAKGGGKSGKPAKGGTANGRAAHPGSGRRRGR